MFLPSSRQYRRRRLTKAEITYQRKRQENARILTEAQTVEKSDRVEWNDFLVPYGGRLTALMCSESITDEQRQFDVVDIGVSAWRAGGLECMRELHSFASERCRQRGQDGQAIDYISIWWDGIGFWRSDWFDGEVESI